MNMTKMMDPNVTAMPLSTSENDWLKYWTRRNSSMVGAKVTVGASVGAKVWLGAGVIDGGWLSDGT